MFKLNNNIELRNLEEQVQKNKEDIARHYEIDRSLANFGIKIVGTVSSVEDLPDPLTYQGQYGDGFAVGQTGPYDYYIYTRPDLNAGQPNNYWLNVGQLAIQGPQGPQGVQGEQGLPGISSKWYTGAYPENPAENDMFLSTSGQVFQYTSGNWQPVTDIKGPQGIQGIQGQRGPQGPIGPQGQKGETGDVGGFINIYGIVTNTDQLPSPSTLKNLTIAYLLGTQSPYDLYIQVGENSNVAQWVNSGPFNAATLVSSGGVYQNIWDADTKLNKVTDTEPGGLTRVYAVSYTGEQYMLKANPNEGGNQLVQRDSSGRARVNEPVNEKDIANKKYVDDVANTKLDAITTTGTYRAYCVTADGQPSSRAINPNNYPIQIAQYSSNKTGGVEDFGGAGGCLTCSDPVNPYHTANKKYVDDAIANASALYKRTLKLVVGEDEFRVQSYTTNNDQINFSASDGQTIANYINSNYGNSVAVHKYQTTITSDFFNNCSYSEGQTLPITYNFLSGGYVDGTFNVTETIN